MKRGFTFGSEQRLPKRSQYVAREHDVEVREGGYADQADDGGDDNSLGGTANIPRPNQSALGYGKVHTHEDVERDHMLPFHIMIDS
jgi:hypothetical protein